MEGISNRIAETHATGTHHHDRPLRFFFNGCKVALYRSVAMTTNRKLEVVAAIQPKDPLEKNLHSTFPITPYFNEVAQDAWMNE